MSTSNALDSFLEKWRTRWPEWSMAEPFVLEPERDLTVAWFALLQEFDDMLNASGDPTPADAKLAWWGEELRSWAGQRSRHPLGRVLEPRRAPWAQLADVLPDLVVARGVAATPAQAFDGLRAYAEAVAAVEAAVFGKGRGGDAADAVLRQTLAQRLYDGGVPAVPRSLLDAGAAEAAQAWARQLLDGWPARVAGPRPRRIWSMLARARLQAMARNEVIAPKPMATLVRIWWAGRG